MLSFWKKNAGQCAENPWFFKKNPLNSSKCFLPSPWPMSTDVVNPAMRDAEMLTANLAVRLLLAPVAGHNPVKRSCIFCIEIRPASIPYSFFCWANPWRRFALRHLCLGLSSYTAAWIICTCIIRFTFKPLIDIDFSVTLRPFTWQLFETTKLLMISYWSLSQTGS